MAKKHIVNWTVLSNTDSKLLAELTEENYQRLILESYLVYNWKARADIANLLYSQWKKERNVNPRAIAAQQNLFVEIYSKFIQVTEDLALVCMMLLGVRTPVETFMLSDNSHIRSFYESAYKSFSEKQMYKILGLNKIVEHVRHSNKFTNEEKTNIFYVTSEAANGVKNNLEMLANIYFDKVDLQEGKFTQGGPIDMYNGIKHGYKIIHPTKLAKKLFRDLTEESLNIMHRVIHDEKSGKNIISSGGLQKIDDEVLGSIMHNIKSFSTDLRTICETKLLSDSDPEFSIKRLRLVYTNVKIHEGKKVRHFESCFCGSKFKYKKCCGLFQSQLTDEKVYSILGI